MHLQGYKYNKRKKDVYYDKHERSDIVKYRKGQLERIFTYKKYMKEFDDNILEVILKPELKSEEKELIK